MCCVECAVCQFIESNNPTRTTYAKIVRVTHTVISINTGLNVLIIIARENSRLFGDYLMMSKTGINGK